MEEKLYTEEDLRNAFKAGRLYGYDDSMDALSEDEWVNAYNLIPIVIEEKTVPITLGCIKITCGWEKFCDVTGGNHWMIAEWTVSDSEIFHVKISDAKKLGFNIQN